MSLGNQLIYVHLNKGKPFVITNELWIGFGYKEHRYLKWVIEKHESEFLERGILATVEASNNKKASKLFNVGL